MSVRVFVPVLIIATALLAGEFYKNTQARQQRNVLDQQWAQQRDNFDEAQKLRNQLQSIAGATAILAEQGNENAILIRDQLAAQGVTIQPPEDPE